MLLCRPPKLNGHLSTVFLVDHVSVHSICCASNAGWVVAHSFQIHSPHDPAAAGLFPAQSQPCPLLGSRLPSWILSS